ncbi:MAG: aspartate/glutamate racemase family protein [Bacteroidota bacterium]
MKTIGLLGGMGPESTIEYYRGIIEAFKSDDPSGLNYPEIVIYSVNLSKFLGMMEAGRNQDAIEYLSDKLKKIEAAGAGFIALTANTPHLYFDELQKLINVPMLSIVEATTCEARRRQIKRPGLLGTKATMNAAFYRDAFKKHGMDLVVPTESEKDYIQEKLFSEIELGVFNEETHHGLSEIILTMKQRESIDGIILGCTELPLILSEELYHNLPVLDTTNIHIRDIVNWCRGEANFG